jgi:TalC/MipB family fructose-6-phosphate aldolase
MHLYLDTADRDAAEPLLATGLFAGLTTNPTILQRASRGVADIEDIHTWARAAGAREIFFQAWGEDTATLVDRGLRLAELGPDVVVKLVVSKAGAAACAELAGRGIPTLLTAVYHPGQAMIAAAAGATYIAPYLGRLADAGRDAIGDVLAMHELLAATGSTTEVLLASIRDVASMVTLARSGVQHFTFAPAVAEAFFTEELTIAASQAFEEAVVATTR